MPTLTLWGTAHSLTIPRWRVSRRTGRSPFITSIAQTGSKPVTRIRWGTWVRRAMQSITLLIIWTRPETLHGKIWWEVMKNLTIWQVNLDVKIRPPEARVILTTGYGHLEVIQMGCKWAQVEKDCTIRKDPYQRHLRQVQASKLRKWWAKNCCSRSARPRVSKRSCPVPYSIAPWAVVSHVNMRITNTIKARWQLIVARKLILACTSISTQWKRMVAAPNYTRHTKTSRTLLATAVWSRKISAFSAWLSPIRTWTMKEESSRRPMRQSLEMVELLEQRRKKIITQNIRLATTTLLLLQRMISELKTLKTITGRGSSVKVKVNRPANTEEATVTIDQMPLRSTPDVD